MEITKEKFDRYEEVRIEGNYNMFEPNARFCTGLDKEEYEEIMKNYEKYSEEFNE